MDDDETVRLCRGVRRRADTLLDDTDRIAALLSVCSADAVVAGYSAAKLHGLWLPEKVDPRLEVVVHSERPDATRRSHHRRPEIRARRQELSASDIELVEGIAVTTMARTFVDLADRLAGPDLLALGDSALRCGTPPAEVFRAVDAARHRRGVIRARAIAPLLDARSRSRPESHLRFAVIADDLPCPEVNVPVYSALGEWLGEPDLSYEDLKLALEYNGRYHADVDRMRSDITRTLDIEDRGGWRVVVFGPVEVFRRPDQVQRRIRRLRLELSRRFSSPVPLTGQLRR